MLRPLCPPLTVAAVVFFPPPLIADISGMQRLFYTFFFFSFSISSPPQHRAFKVSDQTTKDPPPTPPNIPLGGLLQCLSERREHFLEVCALLTTWLLRSLSFLFFPCPFSLSTDQSLNVVPPGFFCFFCLFALFVLSLDAAGTDGTQHTVSCRAQHVAPPHCLRPTSLG